MIDETRESRRRFHAEALRAAEARFFPPRKR
jgi:hypothetical protein